MWQQRAKNGRQQGVQLGAEGRWMQRAEGRGHRARGSGEGHLGSLEQPYKVVHIGCQAHLGAKGTCTVRCVLCSCVWLQTQPSLRGESIGWVLYSLINTVLYLSLHIGPVPPVSSSDIPGFNRYFCPSYSCSRSQQAVIPGYPLLAHLPTPAVGPGPL